MGAMEAFIIIMYRPDARARTSYPKLKNIVSPNDYDSFTEEFERQERQLLVRLGSKEWLCTWPAPKRRWKFTT